MKLLLVDNSKSSRAVYTPMLIEAFRRFGADVVVCSSRDDVAQQIEARQSFDAIVLSGSSLNMSQSIAASSISKDIMALLLFDDLPCLGVCFGMQLMSVVYGGTVERLDEERDGHWDVTVVDHGHTLLQQHPTCRAFFHHQDVVTQAPSTFVVDGLCADGTIASIRCDAKRRYGVQFHPERSDGSAHEVLRRFLTVAHADRIPVTLDVSLSRTSWGRIAIAMGGSSVRRIAHDEDVSPDVVMRVWNAFRRRYQIKAVLI